VDTIQVQGEHFRILVTEIDRFMRFGDARLEEHPGARGQEVVAHRKALLPAMVMDRAHDNVESFAEVESAWS
jgi:hypothetical protein